MEIVKEASRLAEDGVTVVGEALAVKFLADMRLDDSEAVERFQREVAYQAEELDHPNVMRARQRALGYTPVAPATAHRWWHRWRDASDVERASRACLSTRRPVPKSCPWALSSEQEQAILKAREKTNWGRCV